MYITQLCILFLVTDLVSSSLLLHVSDITVRCTRSLRGANLTIALSLYTDRTSASRSLSFYNNTVDYYVAKSGHVFNFAISKDTTVILLNATAILLTFDGTVTVYRGDANLLSLNAYKWDGQTTATLNASFSDPLQHSFSSMRLDTTNSFKWYQCCKTEIIHRPFFPIFYICWI
ncbi:hypothetical protein Tcan_08974 [Toxocara canis]|uniref:Uncharacterized protein n=1 Tax=Toxocara canis TaxID=6265 RepID=A0A0B2VFA0_TOXCA|nr:hypothetical protein Tcan_08974 [Toxocara canis]